MMKKILFNILPIVVLLVCSLASCGDKYKDEADKLFEEARVLCDKGEYDKTLSVIDTLRNKYPKAIDVRKKALKLHMEASEKKAQKRVAEIDASLQQAEKDYLEKNTAVENLKKEGRATREELTEVIKLRMHRDSLRTEFEVECEKLKFIHKKQQEVTDVR